MEYTANDLLNWVIKGCVVCSDSWKHSIHSMCLHTPRGLYVHSPHEVHEFIKLMQTSLPQEQNQLERFGMILNLTFDMANQTYSPFTISELKFLIDVCMNNTHIHHFVRYILGIIIKILKGHRADEFDAHPILPDLYSFLVFLTKYHQEKEENDVCWSSYITYAWCIYFNILPNMCEMFYEDYTLVALFTNILQCKAKRYFITFKCDGSLQMDEYCYQNDFCFEIVYDSLLRTNIYFRMKLSEYYPFILAENTQLQDRRIINTILRQVIKENHYPKSASKK
jgi:hypothetical protein